VTIWQTLSSLLGVREDQAEDVLKSEASARASLSRRGLFQAAGAVAAGTLFFDVPALGPLGIEARLPDHPPFFGVNRVPLVSFNDMMKKLYPIKRSCGPNEEAMRIAIENVMRA
jgi:hypothetical protein